MFSDCSICSLHIGASVEHELTEALTQQRDYTSSGDTVNISVKISVFPLVFPSICKGFWGLCSNLVTECQRKCVREPGNVRTLAIIYSHVAVADWDKETKDRVSLLSIGVQCHMQTHTNTLNLVRVSVLTLL